MNELWNGAVNSLICLSQACERCVSYSQDKSIAAIRSAINSKDIVFVFDKENHMNQKSIESSEDDGVTSSSYIDKSTMKEIKFSLNNSVAFVDDSNDFFIENHQNENEIKDKTKSYVPVLIILHDTPSTAIDDATMDSLTCYNDSGVFFRVELSTIQELLSFKAALIFAGSSIQSALDYQLSNIGNDLLDSSTAPSKKNINTRKYKISSLFLRQFRTGDMANGKSKVETTAATTHNNQKREAEFMNLFMSRQQQQQMKQSIVEKKLIKINMYSKEKIRELAKSNMIADSSIRSLCWKYMFGIVSDDFRSWAEDANISREGYSILQQTYLITAEQIMQISTNPNISQEQMHQLWKRFLQMKSIEDLIQKDIPRTRVDDELFQNPIICDILKRILLLFALLNPGVGYRQGMNEIAAFIISLLHSEYSSHPSNDSVNGSSVLGALFDKSFIEHDAFSIMSQLMGHVSIFFVSSIKQTKQSNSIEMLMDFTQNNLLRHRDFEMWSHISNDLNISPEMYLLRWIRVLFSRDLPEHNCLRLWDSLIADMTTPSYGHENIIEELNKIDDDRSNSPERNHFLVYFCSICVSFICHKRIREALILEPCDTQQALSKMREIMMKQLTYEEVQDIILQAKIMTRDFYIKQMILSHATSTASNDIEVSLHNISSVIESATDEKPSFTPAEIKNSKTSYFVLVGDGGMSSNSEADIDEDRAAYIRL